MMRAHHVLQRLLVRMQHDAAFADEVLADPRPELERLGLGERERGWLASADRRAFRHDPLRRRRALHSLMGELKASSAIALAETRRIGFLDAFFSSPQFHAAVQQRGSLAAAFGDYLIAARLRTPQLGPVVCVEAAMASSRRALTAAGGPDWKAPPVPAGGLTHVARAPGVLCAEISPDALPAIQAAERYLFEVGLVPAIALADDAPRLELPSTTRGPAVRLGFIPVQSGISLVELDPDTFRALRLAEKVVPASAIGAELAASLVEDEVLIAVSAGG